MNFLDWLNPFLARSSLREVSEIILSIASANPSESSGFTLRAPSPRVSEKTGHMYWVKHEQTLEKLHRIVKYIKSFKPKYHDYNRFLIYRKKSDMIWNQNFNDYFQNYQIDEHNELVRVK